MSRSCTNLGLGRFPVETRPEPDEHGFAFPTWEQALRAAFEGVEHAYEWRRRTVVAAHDAGLSYKSIASAVGMSTAGVHKIAGGAKKTRSQDELLKAQAGTTRMQDNSAETGQR